MGVSRERCGAATVRGGKMGFDVPSVRKTHQENPLCSLRRVLGRLPHVGQPRAGTLGGFGSEWRLAPFSLRIRVEDSGIFAPLVDALALGAKGVRAARDGGGCSLTGVTQCLHVVTTLDCCVIECCV
jgi:hypothetical protein